MALKSYNPTTSSQRGLILVDKSSLWKGKPVKALTEGKRKTGGRNNKGHVTSRGIAGGHKQRYRYVDFKRRKWDVPATVERLEYDPNRTAFIALVKYEDGELAYILARWNWARCRSAPSSTMSRCARARAARLPAPPAPMCRSSAAIAAW
jgi:large subunit ribosomal protein L2